MTQSEQRGAGDRGKVLGAILVVGLAVGGLLIMWPSWFPKAPAPAKEWPVVRTSEVELKDGRLIRKGTSEVFGGWLTESYKGGGLRSRSFVSNGVLEGLSEGWHTNGVLQVSEQFVGGRSEGVVTKWDLDGRRSSEAITRAGLMEGRFQRWHTNGTLAEEMEMLHGQPHGMARSWYPSGSLKAEVQLEDGKVVSQRYWDDVAPAPKIAGANAGGTL
jgi:antitoxin component YwqK of YwqJK toxin-antitoxin module